MGVQKPTDADAIGDTYCFEKGATKSTGGNGFADVWKKGCFGWEYKGPKADLNAAYTQLQRYAIALENPPLLIVSDTKTIVVRTNWTNTVSETHTIELKDLVDAKLRDLLRSCFENPGALKPKRTRDDLTKEAADEFSILAQRLRDKGYEAETVAHFVNRLVFCMFAEDVGLLPNKMFERAIEHSLKEPDKAQEFLRTLFAAMNSGGAVGFETVPWFNGGLFDDDEALPLDRHDAEIVYKAAKLYWADIDPSILGTLFERGLDPSKRSQLGAHYTDREKIMMILNPVIVDPLEAEWTEVRATVSDEMEKSRTAKSASAKTQAYNRALRAHSSFIERLANFRVLDPACGSGNFLYLSLKALKDIEHKANVEAEAEGLPRGFPRVGPEAVQGIEINSYAAELARVSIWIGEIQWMRANGFAAATNPILKPLNNIECRDAVLNQDGTAADWPDADVIVGNPPFLGNKKMIDGLGEVYTVSLRNAWPDVPRGVDFVTYWVAKAWTMLSTNRVELAGLVTTTSIREGANRSAHQTIVENGRIFHAWADEPWVVDGAAVRVSLVCFDRNELRHQVRLDGEEIDAIASDLRGFAGGFDASSTAVMLQNSGTAFIGVQKSGPFELERAEAAELIALPLNPNGRPNTDVLKPWLNGMDVARRPSGKWIIDFGPHMSREDAALYEAPFEFVRENVKPLRDGLRRQNHRERWWIHGEARPGMRSKLVDKTRFIVTPRVAKHRFFVWAIKNTIPDSRLVVIARDDDYNFGVLSSKFHEIWTLATCSWHGAGNDPTYNANSCFETFPFPEGLTPDIGANDLATHEQAQEIGRAAKRLNELRENWLNPPDLVRQVPALISGFPNQLEPKDEAAANALKPRTLTNLYNERPSWLVDAHYNLDRAVADAYGWKEEFSEGKLTDETILSRLFDINQERASNE